MSPNEIDKGFNAAMVGFMFLRVRSSIPLS